MILEYCPQCCRMTETRYGHCLDCGIARRVFTKPRWPRPWWSQGVRKLTYLVGGSLFALVVGPCLGCARSGDLEPRALRATHYEAHISPTWDPTSAAQVAVALEDWSNTTGVTFTTSVSDDACAEVTPCFRVAPATQAMAETDCGSYEPNIIGCTYAGGTQVAIDVALTGDEQLHVMRHEIGHALGLDHTVELDSVMYYSTAGSATITGVDVAQYDWLRGGPAGGFELDTEHP